MSDAPLWTVDAMAHAMGAGARAARCRHRSPAFPSTAAPSAGRSVLRDQGRTRDGHEFVAAALAERRRPRGGRRRRSATRFRRTRRCSSSRTCSTACAISRAPRARARAARSSPSPARSARPAPRRRCGSRSSPRARRTPRSPPTTITGACRSRSRAAPRARALRVFEIGMNHAGEIAPLGRLVRPHVAIITTIEPVHLEYLRLARGDRRRQGGNLSRARARRRRGAQSRQSRNSNGLRAARRKRRRRARRFLRRAARPTRGCSSRRCSRNARPCRRASSAPTSTYKLGAPGPPSRDRIRWPCWRRRRSPAPILRWRRSRSPGSRRRPAAARAVALEFPGGARAPDRRKLQRQSGLHAGGASRCSGQADVAGAGPPHRGARRHAGTRAERRRPASRPGRAGRGARRSTSSSAAGR